MPDGIIFDLFGTLVRNEELYTPICNWMSNYSCMTAEELKEVFLALREKHFNDYHNKPFAPESFYYSRIFVDMIEQGAVRGDPETLLKVMYESFREMLAYEDIDVLHQLHRDYRICIVTNADNSFVYPVVKNNQIPFDAVITSEDARSYKPSPRIFNLAINSIGMTKDQVIVVGDSVQCDFLGPRELGISSILIDRSEVHPEYSPRVMSLAEVNEIIARI